MKNENLEELVESGTIKRYLYQNLDEIGNIGRSTYRNTEQLVIEFLNGKRLIIDTLCSGSSEDTSLLFITL